MEGVEAQVKRVASIFRRSNGYEPLESASSSQNMPAVEVGEDAAARVEVEKGMVVVVLDVAKSRQEKAPVAAAGSTGSHAQGTGEAAEQDGGKGKKKRRWWLPDPEKRWPVQGW